MAATTRRTPFRITSFAPWAALLLVPYLHGCGPSQGQATAEGGTGDPTSTPALTPPSTAGSQDRVPPPGHAWVIFGTDTVVAEVARTPEEREQGLMYRERLLPGRGMLFVFEDIRVRSFWMMNTFIPLDIAYLDENATIVDIQAMEPGTTELHESASPCMFALEVPLGWFRERGIGVGAGARMIFGPR